VDERAAAGAFEPGDLLVEVQALQDAAAIYRAQRRAGGRTRRGIGGS
jgi:hypothetical protein